MLSSVLYGLMLVPAFQDGWDDVRAGDCLTVPELQALSDVEDTHVYSGGACNGVYAPAGNHINVFDCGIQLEAGSWNREMVRHKEAGVFFPAPVPCQMSVKRANNRRIEWEPIGDINSCDASEFRMASVQDEDFRTKDFSAGQGTLYLPSPFSVTRRDFLNVGDEVIEFCEKAQFWLEYTGWGALKGDIKVTSCDGREVRFCKKARLSASENSNKEMCLKIDRLDPCS